jgi:hypothetical protein
MQIKETLRDAVIFLDKDEDFSNNKIKEVFDKIKNYKKLPFHDVIVTMNSKYFVKFLELINLMRLEYKEIEIKNNKLTIQF